MGKIYFSLLFIILHINAYSQHYIQDLDHNPISEVKIYNSNNISDYVTSNFDGTFELKPTWGEADSLIISHTLYQIKTLSFNEVKSTKIIYLLEDINLLEEIIVTVNNNEDLLKQRAERRTIINKREIEKFNPQTSADLLGNKPGISIQKTQTGGGSPNIRGNEANRILLMIDGVRMNNAIYRGGHLQNAITVDPSILANSEILYGPSSVVYGSDALGGVVHFRTRIPDLTDETDLNYYSSVSTGNRSLITHVDLEYGEKKFAFLSSFTHKSFGDVRMGNWRLHGDEDWGKINHYFEDGVFKRNDNPNVQKNSGYIQIDALQKIVYKTTKSSRLIANIQYSTSSDINRQDQLNDYKNGALKYEQWYYGPQNRILGSLTFEDWTKRKLYDKAEIVGAYQHLEESRHTKKTAEDFRVNREEHVDVISLNANFKKNTYGYGIELIGNNVDSDASKYFPDIDSTENFTATRYPTNMAKMSSFALYVKKEHSFNEKFKGNIGVRLTKTRLQGEYSTEKGSIKLPFETIDQHNTDFNWNTSIVFHPTESSKIAAIVATGFHAPNIDDIAKYYEKGNNIVLPNLDLKSEYITNYELNFSKHLDNKHLFNLDLYYTQMKDPIIKASTFIVPEGYNVPNGLNPQSNINAKKAYLYGSSFYMSSQWNKFWSTSFDLTYTFGKITEHHRDYSYLDDALAHIPPLFGKFSVEHKNKNFRQRFTTIFNSRKAPSGYDAAGVDNLDEGLYTEDSEGNLIAKGVPAWFTFNYSLQYDFSEQITLQGGVSNILDIHYKTFASGISAMGRSLNITLRAKL